MINKHRLKFTRRTGKADDDFVVIFCYEPGRGTDLVLYPLRLIAGHARGRFYSDVVNGARVGKVLIGEVWVVHGLRH